MSLLRRTILTLSALVLAGSAWAETPPAEINFGGFGQGFGKPSGLALLAIAQQKGFIADEFRDQPVKLNFEYFTGVGPAINEALANQRLDFAQYGGLPVIIGKSAGLPTKAISSYGYTTIYGLAREGSGIESFADIRGKRIGVKKGTILHWSFLKSLEAHNLGVNDVQILDLNAADQLAALAAGSIDAAIGSSSLLTLRDQDIGEVFYTSREVPEGKAHGFGVIAVREPFAQQYPEATQKVANGLVRAAAWLADPNNREEAYQLWALSGVRPEHLREEYEGADFREAFSPRLDPFLQAQFADGIEFSRQNRLIRSTFSVDELFEPNLVEEAIRAQGLQDLWPARPAS